MKQLIQPTILAPSSLTSRPGLQNRKPRGRCLLASAGFLVAAFILTSPAVARAQSGTWAVNQNGNWSDTTKWSSGIVADGAGNTADFNHVNISQNRNITLDSSRTIGSFIFGDTSGNSSWTLRTLNSSVLTMDNGASKPLARAVQTTTISVMLAGTNGIRGPDTASGTIVLNAANSYAGDTEVDRHIMKLGVADGIPSGAGFGNVVMLATNGNSGDTSELDLNTFSPTINGLDSAFDPITYPSYPNPPLVNSSAGAGTSILTVGNGDANGEFGGIIQDGTSRTLALTKIGGGTQALTNANTYTGPTTISGGTLALTGLGSIFNSSSVTVGGGATFDVSGVSFPPYAILFGQTLGGSGGTGTIAGDLLVDGGATLALTYSAGTPTITVSSGTLTLNGTPTTVTVTGSPLANGSYKLISKSGTGTVGGTAGAVTVGGSGIAGGGIASLSISSGELYLDITGGATVLEWGSGDGTWAVGVSGWGSGGATVWADGDVASLSDTYSSGNPTITLNTEVLPQGVFISSTKSYTISGSGDIGGSAEVRMIGPGALTLDVANAHTGGTTLSGGMLNVKNAAALGSVSGTFTINGGTLDNTSGSALTLNDYPGAWNGSFAFSGSSYLNLGTGAVTLSVTPTITVNGGTLTVGGDIAGSGFGLVKDGTGTLVLGGNDSFTGGVNINLGEVILANDGALNSASPVSVTFPTDTNVKVLSLNGHSVTINNLAMGVISGGTATVVQNNHASTAVTLTVNVPSSAQYAGTIADGGAASLALTKTGAGNWTFGGSGVGVGTYSGDTTVSAGKLIPGANNIFPFGAGKGNMIIESTGTLDMLDRQPITVNGLSGSGIVNSSDKGGLPGVSVLNVGAGDASAEFSGVIENVPASGKTAGTVTLVKIGSGTQTLSGVNTYSGTTTVSAGTLLVNSPGSLPATAVTVNSDATLGGSGTINGPVTVDAGGTIAAGDSPGILTLAGGLDLSAGGTNVWELAALNDDASGTPGTDYDQIALTGGTLNLGGSSTLRIQFTGTATAPDSGNPFWQTTHNWTIISASGAASSFATIENGVYPAGNFTASAEAGGIVLTFTPGVATAPVTNFSIAPGPGSDLTLSYSGGAGTQFVLLQTNNVTAPLSLWTRVQTNASSPGTFTITPGADPQEFYSIKSE